MTKLYHLTPYCCPQCGIVYQIVEWADQPAPLHPPVLTCPVCKGPAVQAGIREQELLKQFVEKRESTRRLLETRTHEQEQYLTARQEQTP